MMITQKILQEINRVRIYATMSDLKFFDEFFKNLGRIQKKHKKEDSGLAKVKKSKKGNKKVFQVLSKMNCYIMFNDIKLVLVH